MNYKPIAAFALIVALYSCQSGTKNPAGEVVAEVKGKYLYQIDIQDAMPKGLNAKDSTLFAKQFIRNWITDELVYDVARKNIADGEKIDELVEQYRRQLITGEYQRYLVEEKLSSEISDDEIEAYRAVHKAQLVLRNNQIKGLFIKIPVKAPQHNQLHAWMQLKKPDDLDKINQYSIRHAVAYEDFTDRWVDFDEVMANIPYSISNPAIFLKQNKQLQVNDTAYYYMLAIKEVALAGSPYPEELAKSEARQQIVSRQKVNYLARFRDELLDKAIKNKDAVISKK